jgi:hypothetical protein
MQKRKWSIFYQIVLFSVHGLAAGPTMAANPPSGPIPKIRSVSAAGVSTISENGQTNGIELGQCVGDWTLMAVLDSGKRSWVAVFEDFSQSKGQLLFLDQRGVALALPKSLEPTFASSESPYLGHTLEDVFHSEHDLMGEILLAKPGDPEYDDVAACIPPIAKMHVYTFVGTHDSFEKVGIFYGGATPNFDPAAYITDVAKVRDQARVLGGLVGGWLPVVRFVYPSDSGGKLGSSSHGQAPNQPGNFDSPRDWSEFVAFAPPRVENQNLRVQPVWYRLSRIENKKLKWVRYFDSYHPFPPRSEPQANAFYSDLLATQESWRRALAGGMTIDIPDQRLANLAKHSLVREMITRIGAFPKYGVFDRGYGGSEHDGFPDTFNSGTTAMLEWGLFDLARQYLDNYFTYFVRDDGSILYRGPETGQFGRMLTVAAEYANYTGDDKLLVRHRTRLDAVAKLLLSLRAKAVMRSRKEPAFGMIAGWSEADACLDPEPGRYMQPYFSNSTEAARGFEDLGAVWERIGETQHQPEISNWGRKLRQESIALTRDVQTAIARSMLTNVQPPCLPAIAGAQDPFDVAAKRDKLDPQFRSYRAYVEMLYSGNLLEEQVRAVLNYRSAHHDIILGIPTVYGYNTHELGGFLSYAHAYGLVQHDMVREFLLTLYSLMANQYTRGTWTAPETRNLDPKQFAAPYCTPAQLTVPLMTRWMLVFEDPTTHELWLAKATPRNWLQDGRTIALSNAPTQWGPIGFAIHSHISANRIEASLSLPAKVPPGGIKLRLRVPESHRLQSITLNGGAWIQWDAARETVTMPAEPGQRVDLGAQYTQF